MQFGTIRTDREIAAESTDARRAAAVLRDRVDLLYSGNLLGILVSLAVAAFYFYVQIHERHDGLLSAWFIATVCVMLGRSALNWRYHRVPTESRDPRRWLIRFRYGAHLTAVLWGAAGILFFPENDATLQALTILVLSGVAAGGLSALAADFLTYRNYVVITVAPVMVHTFTHAGQMPLMIGLMSALLIVFLLRSGRQASNAIVDALDLRHQNAMLADNLQREKARLLNDTETVLMSLLSSAPIALWAVDNGGQVTFVEGLRFRERADRILPAVGDNLLHVADELPQIAYETQRALNGESFSTEVSTNGHTCEVHYSPLRDEDGSQIGAIAVAVDISDRIEHKNELARRAHYDDLTGLPNRTLIMSQIRHAFENARRHKRHVALFFLDLDNFKGVNDSLGHAAGDALLCQAAERLRNAGRQNDMAARLGGDEFLVISEDLQRPEDAEVIAHKIARLFQRPFVLEGREVFATTSIGIALYPQDGQETEVLLRCADTAMYHAKSTGKNRYRFFTREMQETADRHLAMESELRQAVRRNELTLMFQPKYDVRSGEIRGAEALLRWHSPTLGKVTPDDFIPVAEYAGLMPQIGNWVLQNACREAAAWRTLRAQPVHVAINVSPQQFRNTDLLANVTQALVETNIPPQLLELEITESVLVQDAPETMQVFHDLNDLGISLSLDDFGTGYSSLSYLKKFPIRTLKIDKAFVQDIGNKRDDESLVEAIVAMAHSLRLEVVAEGVETREQFAFLRDRDVELVQGYHFSPPIDAQSFRALLGAEAGIHSTPLAQAGS